MKDREIARAIAHQAELQKEQAEVSRLKTELEKAQSRNAEVEKSAAEEKQLRVEDTRKLKESAENTEFQLTLVQHELEDLMKKADTWLAELCRINIEMKSKFPLLLFLCRHSLYVDM